MRTRHSCRPTVCARTHTRRARARTASSLLGAPPILSAGTCPQDLEAAAAQASEGRVSGPGEACGRAGERAVGWRGELHAPEMMALGSLALAASSDM